MARVLLTNRDWDFPTDCWVCEPGDEDGLGIPFYLDEERRRIVADYTPGTPHPGAPEFGHGGLSTALLDEGMAWAVIALAGKRGVTRRAQSAFARPVRIGQPHTIECWIEGTQSTGLVAAGEILDSAGRVCVSVRADFYVMTPAEAELAMGRYATEAAG